MILMGCGLGVKGGLAMMTLDAIRTTTALDSLSSSELMT